MTIAMNKSYYDRDGLTAEELNFFEKELNEKKIKIEKNIKVLSQELSSLGESDPRDEGDHAMLAISNLTNNRIFVEQQKSLNLIQRSLNKIKVGSYGICSSCEERIDIERLKVKNFTEYCVPCQEEIERGLIFL